MLTNDIMMLFSPGSPVFTFTRSLLSIIFRKRPHLKEELSVAAKEIILELSKAMKSC